jgi:hypothetical protein
MPYTGKFKAGDAVKILNTNNVRAYYINWPKGEVPIGRIHILTAEDIINNLHLDNNYWGVNFRESDFELVGKPVASGYGCYTSSVWDYSGDCVWDYTIPKGCPIIINKKNKIMSNIINVAKNILLSSDEKLLRKHGLKNECGDYTCEAKEIVLLELCKQNESKLLEVAKSAEEEQKQNK